MFFFFVITDPTLVNTSTSDHEKHGKVRRIGKTKTKTKHELKLSYLTCGQSCKHGIIPPSPPQIQINIIMFYENVAWDVNIL